MKKKVLIFFLFHLKHLKSQVPPETNYAELICGSCMDKLPFLNHYLGLAGILILYGYFIYLIIILSSDK